jgi:hypothetical protein
MKNRWGLSSIWGVLSALLIIGVLTFTLWGNSSNLNPRLLFIDEQITFYPIIKLLNPSGLDEFLWLASDGSDYRYGRILWNSIALIALIPAKLFGEAGQIIAGREAGVIFLLVSYLLLTQTYIQKPAIRFLTLFTLISLPYNSYYMSMPKPEPIMLLCAALFLFFYKRNNLTLGKPYWIFLGMAFGAKISFLLPLLILFGASVLVQLNTKQFQSLIASSLFSILYVVFGFVIANPFFTPILLFLAYALLAILLIARLTGFSYALLLGITCFMGLGASLVPYLREEFFVPLLELTHAKHAVGEWIRGTFLRINDGDYASHQTMFTWLAYLFNTLAPGFAFVGAIYVLGVGILLGSQILNLKTMWRIGDQSKLLTLVLSVIGAALLFSPMISVKSRLWGMYLFPGLIFVILAFFTFVDSIELKKVPTSKGQINRLAINCLLVMTIALASLSWAPRWIDDFIDLGLRNSRGSEYVLPSHLTGV